MHPRRTPAVDTAVDTAEGTPGTSTDTSSVSSGKQTFDVTRIHTFVQAFLL